MVPTEPDWLPVCAGASPYCRTYRSGDLERAPGATAGVDDPTIYRQETEWERREQRLQRLQRLQRSAAASKGTIVAWGLPACQKSKLRTLVERLVGTEVSGKIWSIRQIRKRGERTRTLIEVDVGSRLEVIRKLQRAGEVHARVGRRECDRIHVEPRVVARRPRAAENATPGGRAGQKGLESMHLEYRRELPEQETVGDPDWRQRKG